MSGDPSCPYCGAGDDKKRFECWECGTPYNIDFAMPESAEESRSKDCLRNEVETLRRILFKNENATLLTAEILQASGWSGGGYGGDRMLKDGCPDMLGAGYVAIAGVGARKLKTVGDLRKLLDALHIDAVVTVPNGGE